MLDWTQLLVAGMTTLGGVAGAYIAARKGIMEQQIKAAQHEQQQQDMLEDVKTELVEVKRRLEVHNGYAEKFAEASKDIGLLQKDVGYIKEDIKTLKNIPLCKVKQ